MAAVTELCFLLFALINNIHAQQLISIVEERDSYSFSLPEEADSCLISRFVGEEKLVLWRTSDRRSPYTIYSLKHSDSGPYREECWTDGRVTHDKTTTIIVCSDLSGTTPYAVIAGETKDLRCFRAADHQDVLWLKRDFRYKQEIWSRVFGDNETSVMDNDGGRYQVVKNTSALRVFNFTTNAKTEFRCLKMDKQLCASSHTVWLFLERETIYGSEGQTAVLPCTLTDFSPDQVADRPQKTKPACGPELLSGVFITEVRSLRGSSTMSPPVPPLLSVLPSRALVDEEVKVLVENLPPGSPVTLHSLHQSEDRDYWEAYGHYISDARGAVAVAEDLSFGGTYTGREPMGLFWSMRPVPGSRQGLRLRKMKVCSPLLVHVSVYDGHVSEGFREQRPLASALTERWYVAPGVQRISVTERGVRGILFIPPGPGPFPGLLDMWGAGGGLIEYRSSLLASHGYASLALEYFAASEMESANIEFSYFETAFSIVRDHPQVMADRVGILGLSLGTAVAILLAAESSAVKPRCCVCISGSHFYPPGATLKDIFHILVRNAPKIRVDEDNCEIWRDMVLPITEDFSLKVDAGKIKCPVMLLNGLDDQNWPTVECAEDMVQMMRAAGKEHLLTRLSYPDTGHLIEPPFSPHCRASRFLRDRTREKAMLLWGGRTKPHSDAQQDAWRKILAFLQQHLYRRPRM